MNLCESVTDSADIFENRIRMCCLTKNCAWFNEKEFEIGIFVARMTQVSIDDGNFSDFHTVEVQLAAFIRGGLNDPDGRK
mgnify:CR=1 FL=1